MWNAIVFASPFLILALCIFFKPTSFKKWYL